MLRTKLVTLDCLKTKIDYGPFTRVVVKEGVAFATVTPMAVSGLQVWNTCSIYLTLFMQKALLCASPPSARMTISNAKSVIGNDVAEEN